MASGLPQPADCAISTVGLTKAFGARSAVRSLDLAVPRGVLSGFVGPNGAGKTTTIRMLLGLVAPTAGRGSVLGTPMSHPERYLGGVGALIENPAFYPNLSGRANLAVLAQLGAIDARRVDSALERVGLRDRGGDRFHTYSLGMKQRLGIAAALLPSPELLILDEPTNGLDPAGIAEMRVLLRSLVDDGITVFVSSHLLAEIEQICHHLVVIRSGSMVFQGDVGELLDATRPELVATPEHAEDLQGLEDVARALGVPIQSKNGSLRVEADESFAGSLNRAAAGAGITLVHLAVSRPSLEAAFFALTGTDSGDGHSITSVET